MTATKRRGQPKAAELPDTLAEAHDWLSSYWPGRDGSREQQQAWHELRARVFEHVADTDPRHHYEALALAGIDERAAARLAEHNAATQPGAQTGTGTGAGVDRPARPGASHSPHEKGRGDTDLTSG